ncbi:MAG TPA: TFIIB-type zinc ribbon-containing protein [Bacillota bacterium]|nr:TFIIB-type zinc ribbon-containing protein [Bacillota bacterium]
MSSTTYKCPDCGSGLVYNPEILKFSCDYCGSVFEEKQLTDKLQDQSDAVEHSVIYSCPSCGAEVVTDETTAATFCYYCHNPVVLSGRLSGEFHPDFVLPFTVSKEAAKTAFLNWIGKKRYVPKQFYDAENIETITGVYYPYWLANYQLAGSFDGEGTNVNSVVTPMETIVTTKHYDVGRQGTLEFADIERSALQKADRKLADGVHPYNLTEMKAFSETYLSGFQAEKRDIDNTELHESVESELKQYARPMLTRDLSYSSLNGTVTTAVRKAEFKYALLPAWVITYNNQAGRIFYFSMNGQTRATCGILPLDNGKLLRDCALLAFSIAALLCAGGYFLW